MAYLVNTDINSHMLASAQSKVNEVPTIRVY